MKRLTLILVAVVFLACEKKELPVPKHPRVEVVDTTSHTAGELQTTQLDMSSDYRNQIWFSLSENKIVFTNVKTAWDICFQSSENGNAIMLNGARAMKVYKTNYTDIGDVKDTVGLSLNSKADMPSGNLDSTAIGSWQSDNKVYIINRGYNELGQLTGYYKLKVTSLTSGQYTFEYGDVFGSEIFKGIVNKDENYNFIAYSFTSKSVVANIEPKKTDFDLCFTIYTHLFLDPLQYYQVTGVLNNSFKTRIARFTDKVFENIVLIDTISRTFHAERNTIGYDWKSFNLNNNLFTVDPGISYVIQDSKGFYYKLHFVDFYNSSGIKGFPKFEFKRL